MKIAVLFSSYGPYHFARINATALNLSKMRWNISGIELSRNQIEYPWMTEVLDQNFPVISIFTSENLEETNLLVLLYRLRLVLSALNPDVVIVSGYFRVSMLFALAWGKIFRKKVLLFSESTEIDSKRNPFKELIKKGILSSYSSALVGGQPQKRYLEKLGMEKGAIFLGYNIVDNDVFHPAKIRRFHRPIEKNYFLAVNRFVKKKNLPFLISAYAKYRKLSDSEPWDLVLCGDGELNKVIRSQIFGLGLESHVHFPGFLQQDELLPYFAHARCFVHASTHEQWGLVVNEAMASGLPILVSERCGCVEDLIIDGVNGFSFDPYDQTRLTHLMERFSSGEIDLDAMGLSSLEHIEKFSPEYFADGFQSAVEYSLSCK